MVTELGKNLSIVIVTETGRDWQTYATWYSMYKNLPDANLSVISFRNGETPFHMFQWAKRLKINLTHAKRDFEEDGIIKLLEAAKIAKNKKWTGNRVLVIPDLTMALKTLDSKLVGQFSHDESLFSHNAIFLKDSNIDQILNDLLLDAKTLDITEFCPEAKEIETLSSIVSYRKGCGKWIHKLKGCPFSNAAGLVSSDMTVNEIRIIELWKRMCQLYSAVL